MNVVLVATYECGPTSASHAARLASPNGWCAIEVVRLRYEDYTGLELGSDVKKLLSFKHRAAPR